MLEGKELHDGRFLKILWDEPSRIIGINWKATTAEMSDEDFKADLTTFAGYVEQQKARGILVDVAWFRHRPGPDLQPWLVRLRLQSSNLRIQTDIISAVRLHRSRAEAGMTILRPVFPLFYLPVSPSPSYDSSAWE
jgi:hypothetical protein